MSLLETAVKYPLVTSSPPSSTGHIHIPQYVSLTHSVPVKLWELKPSGFSLGRPFEISCFIYSMILIR